MREGQQLEAVASHDRAAHRAGVAREETGAALDGFLGAHGHERGLGVGDIKQIEVVGDVDPDEVRWHARTGETFASRGQKMRVGRT